MLWLYRSPIPVGRKHSWASAFRHPSSQSGTGSFLYRPGSPYSGDGLFRTASGIGISLHSSTGLTDDGQSGILKNCTKGGNSVRVQRTSESAAQLSGVQPSSVVYSVAQSVTSSSEGYSLDHRGAAKITNVQRSFLEYSSVAQDGAAQLRRVP
jgi:hypothetical protein